MNCVTIAAFFGARASGILIDAGFGMGLEPSYGENTGRATFAGERRQPALIVGARAGSSTPLFARFLSIASIR